VYSFCAMTFTTRESSAQTPASLQLSKHARTSLSRSGGSVGQSRSTVLGFGSRNTSITSSGSSYGTCPGGSCCSKLSRIVSRQGRKYLDESTIMPRPTCLCEPCGRGVPIATRGNMLERGVTRGYRGVNRCTRSRNNWVPQCALGEVLALVLFELVAVLAND
jgi:hypothetical protein